MASGYTVGGVDLDSIFMALVGTKRADVGFSVAGQDISNRYEPIGDGVVTNVTNYKSGVTPVDIGSLFRDIGEPLVTVTLSGAVILGTGNPTGTAGLRVNSDGTIDRYRSQDGVWTQINASTDWIIPNSAASEKTYHVKYYAATGTSPSGSPLNTWLNVSTNPAWTLTTGTTASYNGTLSISDDGGSTTLTSAVFALSAQGTT